MAGWHDTLDVQIRIRDWWASPEGYRYGNGFMRSVLDKQPEMDPSRHGDTPGWLPEVGKWQLDNAEPFFVTNEVYEMVDAAAQRMPSESLEATDLITPNGFVLLPKAFMSVDRNGKRVNTGAFSWGPCQTSPDALRIGEAAPAVGTYLMLYSDMEVEDDFQQHSQMVREVGGMRWSLWHLSPWWFGTSIPEIEDYSGSQGYAGNMYLWKWLQTFFRLSMQQIVTANLSIPPRPYARRARRAGRDPGVLVMSLRRRRVHQLNGDDEGEGPDWQFQWLTRGHWRNQWYPSLGIHRLIWIAPFLKGPEGKPFKRPDLRAWTFNR